MTGHALHGAEAVIEWAVAPAPPLPAVSETAAAAAFLLSIELGPRSQRLALRALVAVLGMGASVSAVVLLPRLQAGRLAPLGEALAALAQLAYYGEPAVRQALGSAAPSRCP